MLRTLLPTLLLALACGCNGAVEAEDDGALGGGNAKGSGGADAGGGGSSAEGGGGEGETCVAPTSIMPSGTLTGADGEAVEQATGVVTESNGDLLVIDSCVGTTNDCVPYFYTLAMSDGLKPLVPVGALVEVTIEPPYKGPIRDADQTPTVRIANLPAIDGVDNPISSQDSLWFLSSTRYGCPHPGVVATNEVVCQGDPGVVTVFDLGVEAGEGDLRLGEGDVVSQRFNGVPYTIAFYGGWSAFLGEVASCRWQVRLDP